MRALSAFTRASLNREINSYVNTCLANEESPRASELAHQLGIEPWQLTRLVWKLFGVSLRDWFVRVKVDRAKQNLRNTRLSLNQIAYICGFGTRKTFFRLFRQVTGMTPGDFRKK